MQLDDSTKVKADEGEAAFKDKAVLPFMTNVSVKRVVHLPNFTSDPIKFSLQNNTSQGHPLPPGAASRQMAEYVVTGVDGILSKYNTTGKQLTSLPLCCAHVYCSAKCPSNQHNYTRPRCKVTGQSDFALPAT